MKILLVSPYPPARDGIGTYSALMRRELVAQGHEVAVVAARRSATAPPEVLGSLSGVRPAFHVLVDAIRRFDPDVVHVQFAVAAYGTAVLSVPGLMRELRASGYPVVATLHEVTRDTQSLREPGRMLYRWVCSHADHLIVHTQLAKRCLEALLQDPAVVPELIPHPRARLPESDVTAGDLRRDFGVGDSRIVLAFGFIDVDKGLQDLILALERVAAAPALQETRLVIAGTVRRRYGLFRAFELRDRIYFRRLRRMARTLRLADRVVFAGYVPDASVRPWFEAASLVVLPYRRSEQSGVASLAVAAGAPILTTAVGELEALSTAPAVPPRDPAALASALAAFLETPVGSRKPSASGPDLDTIVARTVAVYTAALQSRGGKARTADVIRTR